MRRRMILLGALILAGCGGNRSDEGSPAMAEDSAGNTLKVPGDSVRLEDTLSTPPPSDSVR